MQQLLLMTVLLAASGRRTLVGQRWSVYGLWSKYYNNDESLGKQVSSASSAPVMLAVGDHSRHPIDAYPVSQDAEVKLDEITIDKGHVSMSGVESIKNMLRPDLGLDDPPGEKADLPGDVFQHPPKAQVMAVLDTIGGSEKAVPPSRSGPRYTMRAPQDDRSQQLLDAYAPSEGVKAKIEQTIIEKGHADQSEQEGKKAEFMSQLGQTDHQDENSELSYTFFARPLTAVVSNSVEVRPSENGSAAHGLSTVAKIVSSTASKDQSASTSHLGRKPTNEASIHANFDPTQFW